MKEKRMSTQSMIESSPRRGISLRVVSLVLVFLGLLVSGYLSYVKLTDVPMACIQGSVFNCDVVQNSVYSEMFGIPIAWMGFATYIVIGLLLLFQDRIAFLREYGMLILFGVVLFAWVYSMYLVYLQGWVIGAWCQWCLMHEIIMTVLFGVTLIRLRNYFATPLED
jgi:uncharacterized membrane protein